MYYIYTFCKFRIAHLLFSIKGISPATDLSLHRDVMSAPFLLPRFVEFRLALTRSTSSFVIEIYFLISLTFFSYSVLFRSGLPTFFLFPVSLGHFYQHLDNKNAITTAYRTQLAVYKNSNGLFVVDALSLGINAVRSFIPGL